MITDKLSRLQRVSDLRLTLGKTLKSPSASLMNDSGLFAGEVNSPSPPSVKSGDFNHPGCMSTSLDCSFDSSNHVSQVELDVKITFGSHQERFQLSTNKHSDVESGIEDLSSSVGSAVGTGAKITQLESSNTECIYE